jgi:hypothetical protein
LLNGTRWGAERIDRIVALGSGYCDEQRVDFNIVPDVLHFEIRHVIASSDAVAYWNDAWGKVALPDMRIESAEMPNQ